MEVMTASLPEVGFVAHKTLGPGEGQSSAYWVAAAHGLTSGHGGCWGIEPNDDLELHGYGVLPFDKKASLDTGITIYSKLDRISVYNVTGSSLKASRKRDLDISENYSPLAS